MSPAIDLSILMLFGYTLGARLLHALLAREWTLLTRWDPNCWTTNLWGGQVAFAILSFLHFLRARTSLRDCLDSLAVAWAAATIFHKLGCFLAGCCYGAPSSLSWAMTFPQEGLCCLPGQPLHPTQLYDSLSALISCLTLLILFRRRASQGRLILWWGLLYSTTKFASEGFRGDQRFLVLPPLSAAMLIEICTTLICTLLLTFRIPWNRLIRAHENRTGALLIFGNPPSRRKVFLGVIITALLAFSLAILLGSSKMGHFTFPLVYCAFYVFIHIPSRGLPIFRPMGITIIDPLGHSPSFTRRMLRALGEALAPLTLLGLFRPLLDANARTLGDAIAGTYCVTKGSQG